MSETSEGPPQAAPYNRYLWPLGLVIIIALATSSYLAWLALTGQAAAGCGGGKIDCEYVLSSRWSRLLNRPVSLFASSLWVTTLLVTIFAAVPAPPKSQAATRFLLVMLTVAAAGAALWFIGLQAFWLKHWCTYCLVAHGCALVAAGIMLAQSSIARSARVCGALAGLMLAALVPLAQIYLPSAPGYTLHHVPESPSKEPLVVSGIGMDEPRYIEVLGGGAKVNMNGLPVLGSPDADYVLVLLYDYACGHCRILHNDLLAAQREYGGKLAIVMVPTPLSPRCNSHFTEATGTAPQACELAKYALIVQALDPKSFRDFDAWLFEPEKPRSAADARAQAAAILGEDRLAVAEADPRYDEALQQYIALHQHSPADLIPQVMSRDTILSGGVDSVVELVEALENEFGWRR
jgi:uncharacterized membrane protein/protein-disulfide isomerase